MNPQDPFNQQSMPQQPVPTPQPQPAPFPMQDIAQPQSAPSSPVASAPQQFPAGFGPQPSQPDQTQPQPSQQIPPALGAQPAQQTVPGAQNTTQPPVGGPLASGAGQDYYEKDQKSPILGIIALVLVLTVIFAPIGFVLGIISAIKGSRGKRKPLLITGIVSIVIGLITTIISIGFWVGFVGGFIGALQKPDYSSTVSKTFEADGAKVTIDTPKTYSVESDGTEDGQKMRLYARSTVDLKDGSSKNYMGSNSGGVIVSAGVEKEFAGATPAQIKEALQQPGVLDETTKAMSDGLKESFASECSDSPDITPTVTTPEFKYLEVNVKIICTHKELNEKIALKMRMVISFETGKTYIVGVLERLDVYEEQATKIDSIIKGAKFE